MFGGMRAWLCSDSAGGLWGGLIRAVFGLWQVFKENQPWWIGSGCGLNKCVGNSGFAECIGPEHQPWF